MIKQIDGSEWPIAVKAAVDYVLIDNPAWRSQPKAYRGPVEALLHDKFEVDTKFFSGYPWGRDFIERGSCLPEAYLEEHPELKPGSPTRKEGLKEIIDGFVHSRKPKAAVAPTPTPMPTPTSIDELEMSEVKRVREVRVTQRICGAPGTVGGEELEAVVRDACLDSLTPSIGFDQVIHDINGCIRFLMTLSRVLEEEKAATDEEP